MHLLYYLMTSRELTSAFDVWSWVYIRMALMRLPHAPNLVQIALSNSELLPLSEIQDLDGCMPPPSWIFKLSEFGTFRYVSLSSVQSWFQIPVSHWDRRPFVLGIHLMTSVELTSGFDFWLHGHHRIVVMHLLTIFDAKICN